MTARLTAALAVGGLLLTAAMAWADAGKGSGTATQSVWKMWNVDRMIERATMQVSRRYKLTPEQEAFTRKLMATKVRQFLEKYEDDIRYLLTQAMKYQMAGTPPTPEEVQRLTKRFMPLFEEAKRQILEANSQFREILTDEQKKKHDVDLQVTKHNFEVLQERLNRWAAGGFDPEKDFRPPRKRRPAGAGARGGDRRPRVIGPGGRVERTLDYWDLYVRRFINRYKLDAAQTKQAMSILADCKKRALEYRTSHKEDFQKVQDKIRRLLGKKDARKDLEAAYKELRELSKPINDIFQEMKQRLDQIPTEAQRRAYKAEIKRRTEEFRRRIRARRSTSSAPATQPGSAASQPAGK